jgi:hypothetical protein
MEELALYILDIVENALRAGANLVQVDINENPAKNEYQLMIADNGPGPAKKEVSDSSVPVKKTGLGLSMIKEATEITKGSFSIDSKAGSGTKINALFQYNNTDRPELGDIEGTFSLLIASHPKEDYIYNHTTPQGTFCLDTRDIKKLFVSNELGIPAVRHSIKGYVRDNLNMIKASL